MRAPASPLLSVSFRIGCLLALSLALACTRDAPAPAAAEPPPEAVPEVRAPRSEGAPFDVGAIIRQVHFAWRPENGAWSGGHSTYTVRSGAEGLTLTPYHHLRKPDGSALEELQLHPLVGHEHEDEHTRREHADQRRQSGGDGRGDAQCLV
ncbi:hypothetical protein COCOR_02298 [Corallococcus coralloides DSM 2259]|uniref:Lipoprotein n=1 Tax=Corallococcus coralloides (strain ATCC 25202 / DSM 2259 / NBRC 100086 / M2) TaxID=1144275 RepID=H8MLV0_CORCM|nr:hypothetical protein [Corallococcus coralloides]AFE04587.1 hypothetical protein COCOR_02298 [Corallococcus coralloides DSM 2259]